MRNKRIATWLLVCLIAVQSVIGVFVTQPVSALTVEEMAPNVATYSYYSSLHSCLLAGKAKNTYNNNESLALLMEGDYWVTIGYVVESDGDNNDGGVTCQNAIKFGVDKLGFSKEDLLKGLGYTFNAQNSVWSNFENAGSKASSFETLAKSRNIPRTEAGYAWYQFAFSAFQKACGAERKGWLDSVEQTVKSQAEARTAGYYVVQEFGDSSGVMRAAVYKIENSKRNDTHYTYSRPTDTRADQGNTTCNTMGRDLAEGAANRAATTLGAVSGEEAKTKMESAFTTALGNKFCTQTAEIEKQACYDAIKTAIRDCSNAYFSGALGGASRAITIENVNAIDLSVLSRCIAPKINQDMPVILAALKEAAGDAKTDPVVSDPITTDPDDPAAVCIGGGLGFILCPLTTLVSDSITTLATYIESFMRFDPLIGSDQGNAVLSIWRLVVRIANIILVIAFMVVIFSQATSIGLSAYGIKKILPRIIAAAILINISFYICALAVDIANVLGASMQGIMSGASGEIGKGSNVVDAPNFGAAIVGITVPLVIAIGVASLTGAIAFILPVLVSGAVSLFFLFVVLALRHVITFMLIIVSPLAFAAMVLPNTDGLFKKWWKAFYISLALYPIIMALAYGSLLVSKVILVAAPDEQPEATIWAVFAFVALFAWIWALKSIVTWGGGLLSKVTGMVNDRSKGLIDRSRNLAKEKQSRSTWAQMRSAKTNAGNTNAQRRAIGRLSRGNSLANVAAYGISGLAGKKGILPSSQKAGTLLSTQIDKSMAGIQREEREVQGEYMTRTASDLAAKGIRLGRDGHTLVDRAGGTYGNLDSLDKGSQTAMKYMRDNRMMDSVNGMKAIAANLHATGGMNSQNLTSMYEQAKAIDKDSTTDFVAFNNEQARTVSKLSHMMFNAVDGDNNLLVGGNLNTPHRDEIVSKIMGGGFGSLHKDVFGDKDMEHSKKLIGAIGNMQKNDPTGYASEIAKMDNAQIEKYAGMIARVQASAAGADDATAAQAIANKATLDALMQARSDARERFKTS